MKHKHFCVQADKTNAFKEFIDKLNELYCAWYRWKTYGSYYWVNWKNFFNMIWPSGIVVTPEEWIKMLWKNLSYDL